MSINGILETALYVEDLHAAETFYRNVLGLELFAAEYPRHLFFRCGHGMLLIFHPQATLVGGDLPAHGSRGPQHVAFSIPEAELDSWKARLQRHEIPITHEVVWPNGVKSIYFADPEGNSLELSSPALWNLGTI
jgi:catechol 2,3-dioxygenase-like lactoylglutathione lyase family enzyme